MLAAAFVLFYFCPVNETKVMGRTRLILLPYQPRWRTDEWGKFLDGGAHSSPRLWSHLLRSLSVPGRRAAPCVAFLPPVNPVKRQQQQR